MDWNCITNYLTNPSKGLDGIAWFMSLAVPEPNSGCWLWVGTVNCHGYGQHYGDLAHRQSLRLLKGIEPAEGMHVDHKCANRSCVNPDHLEVVTPTENARRMVARNYPRPIIRTAEPGEKACRQGHAIEACGYYRPGTKKQQCAACMRLARDRHNEVRSAKGWTAERRARGWKRGGR
jgi:ribosomal protein S16